MLARTARAALYEHQKAKLDALRNATLHAALRTEEESSEMFLYAMVERPTEAHIHLLMIYAGKPKYHNSPVRADQRTFGLEHQPGELADQLVRDLDNQGLVTLPKNGEVHDFIEHITRAQGIFIPRGEITLLGKRLLKLISYPATP
jgi:hypothetical protein